MFRVFYLLALLTVFGCVSTDLEQQASRPQPVSPRKKIFPDLGGIGVGMTVKEVEAIAGKNVIVGYKKNPGGAFEPLMLPAPYKTESVSSGGFEYEVRYYINSTNESDGVISDDELLPVIFLNNKVMDIGRPALEKLRS